MPGWQNEMVLFDGQECGGCSSTSPNLRRLQKRIEWQSKTMGHQASMESLLARLKHGACLCSSQTSANNSSAATTDRLGLEGKPSRSVPRGLGGSNPARLLDDRSFRKMRLRKVSLTVSGAARERYCQLPVPHKDFARDSGPP